MTATNPTTGLRITAIYYHVEGSKGDRYVVSVDPCDYATRCTCRAGQFHKDCKHQEAVRNGEAGKPHVRVQQRPPRPAARPAGLDRHEMTFTLDV